MTGTTIGRVVQLAIVAATISEEHSQTFVTMLAR